MKLDLWKKIYVLTILSYLILKIKNTLYTHYFESSFYQRHKNIGIIIALVFISWLEFALVVLSQLRYNTAQLPVQTLNTIPERAFV